MRKNGILNDILVTIPKNGNWQIPAEVQEDGKTDLAPTV